MKPKCFRKLMNHITFLFCLINVLLMKENVLLHHMATTGILQKGHAGEVKAGIPLGLDLMGSYFIDVLQIIIHTQNKL